MQTRVAGLIERCQDEVVLEGTLIINDDLNTLFVRYERWLRNSAAAKGQPLPDDQGTTVAPNGVATTSLTEVRLHTCTYTPSPLDGMALLSEVHVVKQFPCLFLGESGINVRSLL